MKSELEFDLPPISGGEEAQVPFKELPAEKMPKVNTTNQAMVTKKTKSDLKVVLIALVLLVLILLGIVGYMIFVFLRPKPVTVLPSPSPSSSPELVATESGLPKNIIERQKILQESVSSVDLEEIDLSFPVLDFKIKF